MAVKLLGWATDWKAAFFAAERRLSPRLEQAIRTDVFLDAMTVANSLSRLAQRSADGARYSIADALGLPTSRQVADLHPHEPRRVAPSIESTAPRPASA